MGNTDFWDNVIGQASEDSKDSAQSQNDDINGLDSSCWGAFKGLGRSITSKLSYVVSRPGSLEECSI